MRKWIKAHALSTYYGLALFFVLLIMAFVGATTPAADLAELWSGYWRFIDENQHYTNIYTLALYALKVSPLMWLTLLFAFAPSLAAVITTFISDGGAGFRQLMSRFKPWLDGVSATQGLKVYGCIFGFFLAWAACHLWIIATWGTPEQYSTSLAPFYGSIIIGLPLFFVGFFLDEGGTLEELGWRGFALPVLMQQFSPLKATLVLGTLWWFWHMPRELPQLLSGRELDILLLNQLKFWLYCVAISILITYVFNRTGGSVWAGILIHGGLNLVNKSVGLNVVDILGFRLSEPFILLMAIVLVIGTGSELGRRRTKHSSVNQGRSQNDTA